VSDSIKNDLALAPDVGVLRALVPTPAGSAV
jgi:hypothetical protein